MGQNYGQLSLEHRCTTARHRQAGKTIRQIAAAMDRAPSTITRELKRNSGSQVGYQPAYAEQQTRSRRWKGSRLIRDPSLQALVLKWLGQGWSPAQVAGRLKKEAGGDLGAAVDLGYRVAVARPPSASERDVALSYLQGDSGRLKGLAWLLFNLDEFLYAR